MYVCRGVLYSFTKHQHVEMPRCFSLVAIVELTCGELDTTRLASRMQIVQQFAQKAPCLLLGTGTELYSSRSNTATISQGKPRRKSQTRLVAK